ncbi:MAG: DEAD/DEAH box helicase [Vulcanimicrobiaceae bacterium]
MAPPEGFFISNFTNLGLNPALLGAIEKLGYKEATPIQRLAIPPALAGRDVLASAPTGSGKSAAFGLAALQALLAEPLGKTRALILVPTRELAAQVAEHLTDLAVGTKIRVAAVHGGVGMRPQIQAFRRGTEVIVATPGRLLDLLGQGEARLGDVRFLVLDEADRMLDMGFLPAVRRIIGRLPARQTLFFSATMGGEAAALARDLLNDPVRVNLTPTAAPLETITQSVYAVEQHKKTDLLVDLLKDNTIYSAIVFTRTKARADRVANALVRHNVLAERIHGDRSQAQRTRALESFKRGKSRVLVATDIAARGIDILDLGHVINYDVPAEVADYVHRIGRTARAKKTGDAITFVSAEEASAFAQIEQTIGRRLDRSDHPLANEETGNILNAPSVRRRTFRRRRR